MRKLTAPGRAMCTFDSLCKTPISNSGAIAIYDDNEILVTLANNLMASNMTKRIDIKHHCI
jgi:hypothetical protein